MEELVGEPEEGFPLFIVTGETGFQATLLTRDHHMKSNCGLVEFYIKVNILVETPS